MAGLTEFAAPAVLQLVPRISVLADPSRARYSPRLDVQLADGKLLQWEEREREDAYLLDWEAARRMTFALTAEVGVAQAHAEKLIAAILELQAAPNVDALVGAMRDACGSVNALADDSVATPGAARRPAGAGLASDEDPGGSWSRS